MLSPFDRFPRLRIWGPIVLGLLIVLIGTLLYLQTRHGFRHVVVPIAGVFLPGTLEVRDGVMDLPGTLEVEGLRYVDRNAGLELLAERAFTVVSVPSFVGGGPPLIHALEVSDATLALTLSRGEDEPPETAAVPEQARAAALLPLVVKHGRIDALDVSIRTGGTTTTMDAVALRVDELAPGGRSQLTLRTNWRYRQDGSGDTWAGSIDAGLTVNQSRAGDALEWSGTASIDLREAPTLPPGGQAVTLKQAVEGSYDHGTGALRTTSSLQVEQGGASLAAARSQLALADGGQGQDLAASLTIERLTAAALNLALAGRAEARFETAEIKGRIDVRGAGDRMTVQSSVRGEQIRLRVQGSRQATPPVAVSIQQAAWLDRSTHRLTLETLDATLSDRARSILIASLDRPLMMHLDRGPADRGPGEAEAEAAKLSVTLNEVAVEEIRPWLALTGSPFLGDVRGGVLQGRIAATVRRQAESVELTGGLRADKVVIETPPSRSRLGPLHLEQTLRATLTNLETVQVDEWSTTVTVRNQPVGRMRAVGAARLRPEVTVGKLSARLTLDELPAEMLNPLLAGAGGARIARARLSGNTTAEVTDRQVVWDASLQGKQLSLLIPDAPHPTAPVDFQLDHSGRFDRSTSVLTLPTLTIKVLEGRRAVLEGTLDHPLTLDLARSGGEEGTASALRAKPVAFRLDIRRLSIEQLRSRLALLGSGVLDDVQGGLLDGRLKIDILGRGETIDIAGHLDASDVRLRDAVTGPLSFRSSLEGTVAGGTQVALKTLVVRVLAGPKELFLFQVAGSTDTARGTANVTAHGFSVDLTNALRRVGWLSERGARLRGGGELSAKLQVVAQGTGQPTAVTGEAKIGNLRTVIARDKILTRTVTAQVDLGVNGERTLVGLRKVEVGVEHEGQSEGSLILTGQWPLDRTGSPPGGGGASLHRGEVVIRASELEAGPLVQLLDLFPGREPGPLPLSIDATVSHDPALQLTRIRGRETLGALSLVRQRAASAPVTVHLDHDLSFRGEDDMQVSTFTLTSERPGAPGDEVALRGHLRLGAKPRLELRGTVAQLDADWYADLFSAPADGEGASGEGSGETRSGDDQANGHRASWGVPLDLDVDTTIGTITYRTIVIGKGRLTGTGTGDRANLTLEPTGLAGGTVQAALALAMQKETPHLSWSAEGKGVELAPITQAFPLPGGSEIKGRAAFTTSGKGHGQGAALEQSLSGTAVIDVTDGEFVKSKLLTYTAQQTSVKEFEGMKFSKVHGELEVADGWVNVTRLTAEGSGLGMRVTGRIGLDGRLEGIATPSVTGELAERAKKLCLAPLLRTVDNFTEFPFAVAVSGTVTEPTFSTTVTTAGAMTQGVGGLPLRLLETMKECGGGGVNVLKGAGKLFEGLLGGEKKKEQK